MIYAVDFDGTIVEHDYPQMGTPVPFAPDYMKILQAKRGAHNFVDNAKRRLARRCR
jgi:hypothetical protein